eukprot:jgi/Mesvir1/15394/Mv06581-RA.1
MTAWQVHYAVLLLSGVVFCCSTTAPLAASEVPSAAINFTDISPGRLAAIHTLCRCSFFLENYGIPPADFFDHQLSNAEERQLGRELVAEIPARMSVISFCRQLSFAGDTHGASEGTCSGVFFVDIASNSPPRPGDGRVAARTISFSLCRRGYVSMALLKPKQPNSTPGPPTVMRAPGIQPCPTSTPAFSWVAGVQDLSSHLAARPPLPRPVIHNSFAEIRRLTDKAELPGTLLGHARAHGGPACVERISGQGRAASGDMNGTGTPGGLIAETYRLFKFDECQQFFRKVNASLAAAAAAVADASLKVDDGSGSGSARSVRGASAGLEGALGSARPHHGQGPAHGDRLDRVAAVGRHGPPVGDIHAPIDNNALNHHQALDHEALDDETLAATGGDGLASAAAMLRVAAAQAAQGDVPATQRMGTRGRMRTAQAMAPTQVTPGGVQHNISLTDDHQHGSEMPAAGQHADDKSRVADSGQPSKTDDDWWIIKVRYSYAGRGTFLVAPARGLGVEGTGTADDFVTSLAAYRRGNKCGITLEYAPNQRYLAPGQAPNDLAAWPPRAGNGHLFHVAQRYIRDPLLLRGSKFHIRAYGMLVSTEPLVAFYRREDVYFQRTQAVYRREDVGDLDGHLTNNGNQTLPWPKGYFLDPARQGEDASSHSDPSNIATALSIEDAAAASIEVGSAADVTSSIQGGSSVKAGSASSEPAGQQAKPFAPGQQAKPFAPGQQSSPAGSSAANDRTSCQGQEDVHGSRDTSQDVRGGHDFDVTEKEGSKGYHRQPLVSTSQKTLSTLDALDAELAAEGHTPPGYVATILEPEIKRAIVFAFRALASSMEYKYPGYYHLLTFDFMLDAQLNLVLLEVNGNSFFIRSHPGVLVDTANLAVDLVEMRQEGRWPREEDYPGLVVASYPGYEKSTSTSAGTAGSRSTTAGAKSGSATSVGMVGTSSSVAGVPGGSAATTSGDEGVETGGVSGGGDGPGGGNSNGGGDQDKESAGTNRDDKESAETNTKADKGLGGTNKTDEGSAGTNKTDKGSAGASTKADKGSGGGIREKPSRPVVDRLLRLRERYPQVELLVDGEWDVGKLEGCA